MHRTIVVVDSDTGQLGEGAYEVISFEQYLNEYPKKGEPRTRIINLCDTEHYLSKGYYCSLLAEARQHRVMPSVSVINDLRSLAVEQDVAVNLPETLGQELEPGNSMEQIAYFGWCEDERWQPMVRQVFENYPTPVLRFVISHDESGLRLSIYRQAYIRLEARQQQLLADRLQLFTASVWRQRASRKRLRWDMAILVNPEEAQPPSNPDAIQRFIKAAAKVGIHAETITARDGIQLPQYDALFLRETTAIDHHTYRLARRAEQEGLVVLDDPTSILRCCNKVFLHDAFSYNGVPAPRTRVVISAGEDQLEMLEAEFAYPMVIKMPESSFSKGVFKVSGRAELKTRLEEILRETSLLLVQEYLYTPFDWRIGVLNGRAIYACRYQMARNHWQIYNHDAKRYFSGGFETLATFEVPRKVLDAAIKAANMIGNGLYGVDLKQKDQQVYVIEVNDNPSIEHGVEDVYLGNELYMQIMSEFVQRLEQRGR